MKRHIVTALVAGAVLAPQGLAAQDNDVRVFSFGEGRARIGVMVDMKADPAIDKLGARIQSVIPGGPAAEAGLKAGDIIIRFAGESLAGVGSEDDMSGPGNRLVELAQKLDPGDEVEVEYRRGDETREVTLTADRVGGTFSFRTPRGGTWERAPHLKIDPDVFVQPHLERFPSMNLFFGHSSAGLNLAELNEDLAEYFGTTEGALVMEAPRDSTLALKGGDVIVAIDGRTVESPSHARRILASYNAGEAATLQVLRQRQRISVTWTVPEKHGGSFYFRQPSGEVKSRVKKESRA
jgi:S1-C subfamily serine protease